jgi:cellulose synthase/poly-beta-1,6-N-acetylglucosamine synthase-like glycosyltransferase
MTLIALLYAVAAFGLAAYGMNALFLTALFLRRRARPLPGRVERENLPAVTVQLPIYNEKYVATRVINAVCALDYPRDLLQVQVLDDSTDETVELVRHTVRRWRRRGLDVQHVRRGHREGYKAGALVHGLQRASGEFIAVFDADFVPERDWLTRSIAHYLAPRTERLGLVQTRWSHLNPDESPLARAQALALDGHFGVEQAARMAGGLLFNFNGTAGLWRRSCIEEAGGWSGATVSEDLDLSYRAQLMGWQLHYDSSIAAPAEIPSRITAYKRQQFRWAKGSIQVARLLAGRVLLARLTPFQKVQAVLHLTGYLVHPLMVVLLLLTVPLLAWGWPARFATQQQLLAWLSVASLGAPLLYGVAQRSLYGAGWTLRYRWMPLLALLGSGVALSNTWAVLQGLFGRPGGEFQRTPKYGEADQAVTRQRSYHIPVGWSTVGELLLAGYALLGCIVAALQEQWFAIPFLCLYMCAFGWVAALSLWQNRPVADELRSRRPWQRLHRL